MRILLDVDRCTGHGRCYALAPEVYDADDDGHCVLRVTGDVPDEWADRARTGALNCPEQALTIEE
jgi:ferredoxin